MKIDLDYNINNMETRVDNKCRAFTSLEQSKKLAEILPLESADMYYEWPNKKVHFKDVNYNGMGLSCWSLAALLGVLPDIDNYYLVLDKEDKEYCCCYEDYNGKSFRHCFSDNPVGACYELILKLHKLKML